MELASLDSNCFGGNFMYTKVVAALLFVHLMSVLSAAQSAYRITDLGPLSPTGINSWAQVVGNYND